VYRALNRDRPEVATAPMALQERLRALGYLK
jgi:hypothetical protein